MIQSSFHCKKHSPSTIHVAIIMDGNGRWAQARGRRRVHGHVVGANAVTGVVKCAPTLDIHMLTLYAFSADNWHRPRSEVDFLMKLFARYLAQQTTLCIDTGVRLEVIGRRDRLAAPLGAAIASAESATADGQRLHLRIAIDYSARDTILRASQLCNDAVSRSEFAQMLALASHSKDATADVDLLIRTGGEQRLSDFLLWECAYAEFVFTPRMWPEFTAADLQAAVAEYRSRQRRYGRLPETETQLSIQAGIHG